MDKLLDFAAGVGRELLENGAETSRVEDTLRRIIHHFYDGHSEIFVVLTGFFVNIGTFTKTVRVNKHTINLDKISQINMLSRDIVDGKLSFDDAQERFYEIKKNPPYPMIVKMAATAVSCGFFTLLGSGNWSDSLNSFTVGALLHIFIWFLKKNNTAEFIIKFTGGAAIAVLTVLLYQLGLGNNINAMITGAIMPLVPGLGITNALRDIIAGDYLSGSARMFDAIVAATALAGGAGSVMYLIGYMSGGKLL